MAQGYKNSRSDDDAKALMVVQPPRLPMPVDAQKLGYKQSQWRALIDAVFPAAKSVHGVMLALDYCKARKLDPFKRVVHVVPMWSSKLRREVETVWPGIGELRTTATRTGLWAGADECQFGRRMRQEFSDQRRSEARGQNDEPRSTSAACPEFDFPEWAQVTVYKLVAGQRVAFVGPKVRFTETFSGEKGLRVPNARWRQAPYQMLEKCAESAALRRAFPEELGDHWSAEEMEGKELRDTPPPIADADYTYVEQQASDAKDDERVDVQAEDTKDEDVAPDLRGWDPAELMDYVNTINRALQSVQSIKKIDRMLSADRETVESLPDQERATVEKWLADARARLAPPTTAKAAPPPAGEPASEEETGDEPSSDQEPWVARVESTIAGIEAADSMAALKRVDEEWLRHCAAMPDEAVNRVEAALIGARRRLREVPAQ